MRVLIDYRPALRERTGVGEYTHELVKALVGAIDPGTLDLTIFSSSWSDRLRLDEPGLGGVHAVDRRVPVRLLNLAWHRLGWPPAEALAGAFDVTHSLHPLLLPSRAAAQVITIHDLSFLESPDRSRPRSAATTRRSSTHTRAAPTESSSRRSTSPARSRGGWTCRARKLPCVLRVRPTGRREPRRQRPGTCCLSGRSSRARTWARCSTRTSGC